MEDTGIGTWIAGYRKNIGITQEELGRAVGVSTQAVSRWECGGTPDVALLPAIADRLGVSIDALFGRDGGGADIQAALSGWMSSLPETKRLDALCGLVWHACQDLGSHRELGQSGQYLDRCTLPVENGEDTVLLKTIWETEQGIALGIGANDLSFMALFPEPKAGYAHFLGTDETYRQLFAALSLPGAVALLRYFYSRKSCYYTAAALAKALGFSPEQVEEALDAMEKIHLLTRQDIVLETGEVPVWMAHDQGAVLPFLYLARILMEKGEGFQMCWRTRERPLFTWEREEERRGGHEEAL